MSNATVKKALTIEVKELKNAPWTYEAALPADWVETVFANCEYPVKSGPAYCNLKAESISNGVRVLGNLKLKATADCSTCLDEVTISLKAEIDTYLRTATDDTVNQKELTPEDLSYETYEGDHIVLDELINDGILLELPMNPRCDGPCRPVEHLVTADELEQKKEIDPRLQALADPGLRRRIKSGSSKEENI